MKTTSMNRLRALGIRAAVALVAMSAAACSLDKQEMPALSGPSGLGLSITMAASPDRLPRDGTSQSVVTVTVRSATGQGLAGRRVALSVTAGALLTQSEIVTGSGGQASFGVVAPSAATVVKDNQLVLSATPLGEGDASNTTARVLTIGLTGTRNAEAPTPAFDVTPTLLEIGQLATFDATNTIDEGVKCLDACTYDWNFDDGGTASGRIATHAFAVGRPYNVTLNVTDASGVAVTLRKLVTPTAPPVPTVELSVVPEAPLVNRVATFTATSKAGPNHSVVRFEWSFGDGSAATTTAGSVDHTYTVTGTFAVTVRAVDDLGQVGSKSQSVVVGSGVSASFFFSPTDPVLGQAVNVNASASTTPSGTTIVNYQWNWGDGSSDASSSPTAAHTYASKNTWKISLTITDSQGGVGTTTKDIAIK